MVGFKLNLNVVEKLLMLNKVRSLRMRPNFSPIKKQEYGNLCCICCCKYEV